VTQRGVIPAPIVRVAETARCDLMVIGTRSLPGPKRLMTGRICNAGIATASCLVLVVPFVK
jgi:nucleotide-binding universal stress UspA family protein